MKYREKLILLDVKTLLSRLLHPILCHILLENAEQQNEEKKAVGFELREN